MKLKGTILSALCAATSGSKKERRQLRRSLFFNLFPTQSINFRADEFSRAVGGVIDKFLGRKFEQTETEAMKRGIFFKGTNEQEIRGGAGNEENVGNARTKVVEMSVIDPCAK
jgi:hypothetical protein